jgi:hypothetical protein
MLQLANRFYRISALYFINAPQPEQNLIARIVISGGVRAERIVFVNTRVFLLELDDSLHVHDEVFEHPVLVVSRISDLGVQLDYFVDRIYNKAKSQ